MFHFLINEDGAKLFFFFLWDRVLAEFKILSSSGTPKSKLQPLPNIPS